MLKEVPFKHYQALACVDFFSAKKNGREEVRRKVKDPRQH